LALYSGTRFNLILFSCNSGSFLDDLDDLDNVLIVSTPCAADEIACGGDVDDYEGKGILLDYNQDDQGVEWISSLLKAMSQILDDQSQIAELYAWSRELVGFDTQLSVPMTTLLIQIGSCGAVGHYPDFGLTTDLDVTHRMEWEWDPPRPHNPQLLIHYFFPVCSPDGP